VGGVTAWENDAVASHVVPAEELELRLEPGDTASRAVAIDARVGSDFLEQQLVRYERGRSSPRRLEQVEEILYTVSGRGTIVVDGDPHQLEDGTAVYIAARESYEVENEDAEPLLLVSVTAPKSGAAAVPTRRVVRYADQPMLRASGDREFRYLVTDEAGCRIATQFFGVIAPGRAPDHSHIYDEVIYVLEGEGVLHADGRDVPVSAGSSVHLPPLLVHSLENSGDGPMKIVAVFHPAGDPASRAYEANE
jgi:mannose-6-phosphate isomerase-like protein (cupin superfamily)